jgi:hypothetical protein
MLVSSIKYQISSIKYQVSKIKHQVSSIKTRTITLNSRTRISELLRIQFLLPVFQYLITKRIAIIKIKK